MLPLAIALDREEHLQKTTLSTCPRDISGPCPHQAPFLCCISRFAASFFSQTGPDRVSLDTRGAARVWIIQVLVPFLDSKLRLATTRQTSVTAGLRSARTFPLCAGGTLQTVCPRDRNHGQQEQNHDTWLPLTVLHRYLRKSCNPERCGSLSHAP